MSDCCATIYDIGCIYSCDLVQSGVNAAVTGVFILESQPEGIKIVSNTVTSGQQVTFSGGYLNEDGITIFKILDPNGAYITGPDGEECFQVKVKPATSPTLANTTEACFTDYEVYISGALITSGTLDCTIDNTINIYP